MVGLVLEKAIPTIPAFAASRQYGVAARKWLLRTVRTMPMPPSRAFPMASRIAFMQPTMPTPWSPSMTAVMPWSLKVG